ncbi:MAG: thiamine diphosphokinase [Chlorobi bacterium]|nr:thiamine diphosphokinase [Chlorobiota bacterium]
MPPRHELEKLRFDRVIAADGSAWQLLERGVVPHVIVGDLDSFRCLPQPESAFPGSHIVHVPNQDSNDFEKALQFGLEWGADSFVIVGMNGGELEHTLNNWSVFLRYSEVIPLEVYDAGRIGHPVHTSLVLPTKPNELISLVPQPRARLTTRGLLWELDDEYLELGRREGARNRSRSEAVEIVVHQGSVLVFYDAFAPWRDKAANSLQ